MVTLKFGGTSVADADAIRRLCAIVSDQPSGALVVVSAMSGVTDRLLTLSDVAAAGEGAQAVSLIGELRARHERAIHDVVADGLRPVLLDACAAHWTDLEALVRAVSILRASPPAFRDAIVANGELVSSRLVAAALQSAGVPSAWVDARLVMATDGRHERAVPQPDAIARQAQQHVRPHIDAGLAVVVGGFVGATAGGVTTTLGRGGSDYSASLFGAALGANEIQIWTDTDGVLTADPRVIDGARTVERLSFREASALAHFGAKVLHPATVAPAIDRGIPVRILNSRRPHVRGTVVTAHASGREHPLAGLASVADVVVLDVPLPPDATRERVLADVFDACATHGATVYASSIGDADVSVTVGAGRAADQATVSLTQRGTVHRRDDLSLLVAAGDGLADGRAHTGEILRALRDTPVAAIAESSRAGFVAVAVPRPALQGAMEAVHARFFEPAGRRQAPSAHSATRRIYMDGVALREATS